MIYPIFELQKDLGNMYRNEYKNDYLIQKNLLEMGHAIKRLLERKAITPFDDFNKVKHKIFDEMDWSKTHGNKEKIQI